MERPEAERARLHAILTSIQGIKCTQQWIRDEAASDATRKRHAADAVPCARKLPRNVVRKITTIDLAALAQCEGECVPQFLIDQLASDAAFAQIVRAANVYRAKVGYALLDEDGWP